MFNLCKMELGGGQRSISFNLSDFISFLLFYYIFFSALSQCSAEVFKVEQLAAQVRSATGEVLLL